MISVAGIIIGDEVLAGDVVDSNSGDLIRSVRRCGANLRRLTVVGDDPEQIGHEVRLCSRSCDYVITSGGVGPTHDDQTIEAIAHAFGCSVVCHPQLEIMVRDYLGDRINEAALKMAQVPEGAELLATGDFPIIMFRNIFILPGIPKIFRAKLAVVAKRFQSNPWHTTRFFLSCFESEVAHILATVDRDHPGVRVGSYPQLDQPDHRVLVSLTSQGREALDRAVEDLTNQLPRTHLVRIAHQGDF